VVKYDYDAWGNHRVLNSAGAVITDTQHIGHKNPFRYRGYYYDRETGLYYLKSRYYDPEIGRFISMDGIGYLKSDVINGLNLYAYCHNNPVMYADSNGTEAYLITVFGKSGLPLVGHSALIIKCKDGYIFTQFTGGNEGGILARKKKATVVIKNYDFKKDITSIILDGLPAANVSSLGKGIQGITSGYSMVELDVDYSKYTVEDLESKLGILKGMYDNRYHLLFHNCADFVQRALWLGKSPNLAVIFGPFISGSFIPVAYSFMAEQAEKLNPYIRNVTNEIRSFGNTVVSTISNWFNQIGTWIKGVW
jgi:RHS repeat-associated protein